MRNACRWRMGVALSFLLAACAAPFTASAENWPTWRGPGVRGISAEKDLPTEWSATKNVAWKLSLPGPAGASPIVWEDRIFLTTVEPAGGADAQAAPPAQRGPRGAGRRGRGGRGGAAANANDDKLLLMCIGTDGKERWRRQLGTGNRDVRGDEGNSASPSPVTDGKLVWAFMGNGELGCYDLDGKEIWRFDLQERYGRFDIQFGMTPSPVIDDEGRLFLQIIHGDRRVETKEAYVVGLEAATGKELWKQPRDTGAYGENEHGYASPLIYDDGAQKFLITHGADFIIAHDLATGRELWRCGGLNPHGDPAKAYHTTLRMVASPGWAPGIIVVPTAKNERVIAIRPGFEGDITNKAEAHIWSRPSDTPDVPSPLIHDGLVYLCRENGNLLVLDAATGEELYYERTHRDRHRASPVYADGHVYLSARDGKVTVVKAGREFEIVSQNDIGESLAASPAISDGTIYLRSYDSLWAIRKE
ncbi:MAG: PQQ-binding-like beta-propeller repeat protein [Planctomycetaceae bacterium]